MSGRSRRAVAAALASVVPVLWSLFLVLAGGDVASAAPAPPSRPAASAPAPTVGAIGETVPQAATAGV
ncbi:MAG TPA: bifunctional RNase H/acid phosphatase, partial [Streptomyces sp.]